MEQVLQKNIRKEQRWLKTNLGSTKLIMQGIIKAGTKNIQKQISDSNLA